MERKHGLHVLFNRSRINILKNLLIILFTACFLPAIGQISISSSLSHSTILCGDNRVFVAGNNNWGQLGFDTYETFNTFTPLYTEKKFKQLIAGIGDFSVGLSLNGEVFVFGKNSNGVRGNASLSNISPNHAMTKVLGGETEGEYLDSVVEISVARSTVIALLNTGEVVAWGANDHGILGIGNFEVSERTTPVYVKNKEGKRLNNIKKISAGPFHVYALDNNGEVWAWGTNDRYQLSTNSSTGRRAFADKVMINESEFLDNIVSISAGGAFGLFLRSTGRIYGAGLYRSDSIPAEQYVSKLPSSSGESYLENVISISAGFQHALAVVEKPNLVEIYTWGKNYYNSKSDSTGQLGLGNYEILTAPNPLKVYDFPDSVPQSFISAGAGFRCSYIALEDSGRLKVKICGDNYYGELGIGDYQNRLGFSYLPRGYCKFRCPIANLGNDKFFCTPFKEELSVIYDSSIYKIDWFYNDTIIDSSKSSVSIEEPGRYKVHITDTTKDCAISESEILVQSKQPNFSWKDKYFCDDSVRFYAVSAESLKWYLDKSGDSIISENKQVTVPKNILENRNNIYTLFVKSEECQRIAVNMEENCTSCASEMPSVSMPDKFCLQFENNLKADGNYIEWFKPSTSFPFFVGNDLSYQPNALGQENLQVVNVDGKCPSDTLELDFFVTLCLPRYSLKGHVFAPKDAFPVWVYLYEYIDSVFFLIDSTQTGLDSTFLFRAEMGKKIIKAVSVNEKYAPTYFGNTSNRMLAYPLDLIDEIFDADIELENSVSVEDVNRMMLYFTNEDNLLILDKYASMRIYSMNGQLLKTCNNCKQISIEEFPNGLYAALILTEGKVQSNKILKGRVR